MPNKGKPDNLIPVRSEDEARERGRKGGIASGKTRRRKKELRKELQDLLSIVTDNPKILANLDALGVPTDSGATLQTAMTASMIYQAIKGNVKAFNAIKEVLEPKGGGDKKEGEDKGVAITFEFKDTSMKEE